MKEPSVGDLVEVDGEVHVVVEVTRIWSPYRKKDQHTTVVGHSLSLRRVDHA